MNLLQRVSVIFTASPRPGWNGDLADALAHEELLELRVLLEVELLVPDLDLVERRHGDVDVAAIEELGHVPVEER